MQLPQKDITDGKAMVSSASIHKIAIKLIHHFMFKGMRIGEVVHPKVYSAAGLDQWICAQLSEAAEDHPVTIRKAKLKL